MSRDPLRASGRIAVGTLTSRITGLVRVGATAAALDIGALSDVYNSANSTPNLVYELLLGGVLTAALVPLFVDLGHDDDREGTAAVFGVVGVALAALSTLAFVAAPAIARGLAAQVDTDLHTEAVHLGTALVRCFAFQILGYGVTAVASAALNARKRFAAAAFAPVLNNLVVTAVMIAVARDDVDLARVDGDARLTLLLGLGTTAGVLVNALALVVPLRRAGVSLRARWDHRHPAVRRLFRASGWTLGYVVANQVALLFVMVIARDTEGALTAYQFAFVFFQLPHGLVAVSIMTAWLPELVDHARRDEHRGMAARFDDGMHAMVLLMVPAAAGYLALSVPIVDSLLTVGDASPRQTAAALTGFAIGLVPFSIYLFALRGFYALGDTRTPFLVNVFENALNIVLAAVGFALWGVRGLALAYAVAYAAAALVALVLLRRRLGVPVIRRPGRLGATVVVGAGACAAAAAAAGRAIDAPVPALAAGVTAGAAAYGLVTVVGARAELGALARRLRRGAGAEPPIDPARV